MEARAHSAIHRPWLAAAIVALALGVVLDGPSLMRVPGQLLATCAFWAAAAIVSELLSVAGFVVVFDFVFGARLSWRRTAIGALRGVGATAALPAGGVVGPVAAASSVGGEPRRPEALIGSGIAFAIVTNAPALIVLIPLGLALFVGWSTGPHAAPLTLLPALVGAAIVAAALLTVRIRHDERLGRLGAAGRALRAGVLGARELLGSGDWRLIGAFANYAFDSAVLVIAFEAIGHPQPLAAITMGYVVGSLGGALPVPGGLGAVEGGLIGALVLYGAPAAPAAAAVLLYRAITLLLQSLLGAVAWGTPVERRLYEPESSAGSGM